jgi:hypothetical protein
MVSAGPVSISPSAPHSSRSLRQRTISRFSAASELLGSQVGCAIPSLCCFPKHTYLEAEGIGYAIRLPANRVLQDRIGYLLKRPVGRPPHEVRRYYASFSYQAQSWNKSRHVVAKVEWHSGELYPRVGFIVSNLPRALPRVSSPSTTSAARASST